MDPIQEIKKIGDELNRDFGAFKEANDKRLALLEKGLSAGSDREEKVDRISKAMTDMEEKIDQLKAVVSRAPMGEVEAKEKQEAAIKLADEAMSQFFRKGRVGQEAHAAYLAQLAKHGIGPDQLKALSVGSDPDGGYLVRPQMSAEITKKVFESSPIREIADVMTLGTDAFEELYDNDEPGSGWVGEQTTRSETDSNEIGMIRIELHELHAQPKASQKLLDDSFFNVESWHAGKVAEKFARDEATAFVSGSGILKPKGFLSYTAGDGFNKVEQVNMGHATALTADGFIDVQDSLLEPFQGGAVWVMKRQTWTAARKLKDANNQYLASVAGDLTQGDSRVLLGKPVKLASDMPSVAASALAVAYGNFKQGYLVLDRVGIRILRDPYTSKGHVLFYTTKRVGGGVRKFQAIKIGKVAA